MRTASSLLIATLLFASNMAMAQSSLGLTTIEGSIKDAPTIVFYPSDSPQKSVQRGPYALEVAENGKPVAGNHRLVVLSHGSGGAAWTYTDLARTLVQAGFVVAIPEHEGDNWHDHSKIGVESWKRRPQEISAAIDAIGKDARFAPLLQLDRVGMYGMSAGGLTALVMAGGVWSPSNMVKHCQAHISEDFNTCAAPVLQLTGGLFDSLKIKLALWRIPSHFGSEQRFSHDDPRIAAVVAAVPMAVVFDKDSLIKPRAPLALIQADKDIWLLPRFHVSAIKEVCTTCTLLADWTEGGHASILSPSAAQAKLSGNIAPLLADPPTFDRAQLIPKINHDMTQYFMQHLVKP